jgi:hypothetical protein
MLLTHAKEFRQDFDVSKLKSLQDTHLGSASFSLLALLFA